MGNQASTDGGELGQSSGVSDLSRSNSSSRPKLTTRRAGSMRRPPEDPTRPPSSRQLLAQADDNTTNNNKGPRESTRRSMALFSTRKMDALEAVEKQPEQEPKVESTGRKSLAIFSVRKDAQEAESTQLLAEQEPLQRSGLLAKTASASLGKGSYFVPPENDDDDEEEDPESFSDAVQEQFDEEQAGANEEVDDDKDGTDEGADERPGDPPPEVSREPPGVLSDDLPTPPPEEEDDAEEYRLLDYNDYEEHVEIEEKVKETPQEEEKPPLMREPSGLNVKFMPKEPDVTPVANVNTKPSRNPYNPFVDEPSGYLGKELPKVVPLPREPSQPKVIVRDEPDIIPVAPTPVVPIPIPIPIPQDDDDDKEEDVSTSPMDSVSFLSPIETRDNVVDLETMKDNVWFIFPDWWRRVSGFLLLIVLASIIATCGIIYDSPATVIGAMIVAPLMTPILGTMLGIILKDFAQFACSIFFVFLGGIVAVGTGIGFSMLTDEESIHPDNNTQVAARISPKLLDLVAALATGAVAAVAMVRQDIAGSLPGVSIAISLVPPLNVVGVCLRLGLWAEAVGALTLFVTNYLCISVVGMLIMALYQVHRMTRRRKYTIAKIGAWIYQKISQLILIALLCAIGIMLYYSTEQYNDSIERSKCLRDFNWAFPGWSDGADDFLDAGFWEVNTVTIQDIVFFSPNPEWSATVTFVGEPPFPTSLETAAKGAAEECDVDNIDLQFIPRYTFKDLLAPTPANS